MAQNSAKATKQILAFLKDKKALFVTTSAVNRPTLRKLCSSFGMGTSNVDATNDFSDAESKIKSVKPQILFVDMKLGTRSGIELFSILKQVYPNRLQTLFFLLSEANSSASASRAAEEEVDAMIVQPFTYDTLEDKFIEALTSKMNPSDYMRLIENGKTCMSDGKPADALKLFQAAKSKDQAPVLACYYEGMAHIGLNQSDEAKKCFEEGLKFNQTHYKCLCGLLDLYMAAKENEKAYEVATVLCTLPLDPQRMPKIIWLSIYNRKYQDIVEYYQVFSKMEFGAEDQHIIPHISAGLIIAGKYFLMQNNTSGAVEVFQKAETMSKRKPSFMKEIVCSLLSAGAVTSAQEFLSRSSPEVRDSPEIILGEFEQFAQTGSAAHIVQRGMEILNSGVKNPKLFEIVIKRSIELKRRRAAIDDVLLLAGKAYPEQKKFFEDLLPSSYEEGA